MGRELVPQDLYYVLSELSKRLKPNRAVKFTLDLSTERSDKSLIEEGVLPSGKVFSSLTVVRVGTGSFTVKLKFADGSTTSYSSDELVNGYMMDREFTDVLVTNSSQTVTNPTFVVDWREE